MGGAGSKAAPQRGGTGGVRGLGGWATWWHGGRKPITVIKITCLSWHRCGAWWGRSTAQIVSRSFWIWLDFVYQFRHLEQERSEISDVL
jgi:hypothetical protein